MTTMITKNNVVTIVPTRHSRLEKEIEIKARQGFGMSDLAIRINKEMFK